LENLREIDHLEGLGIDGKIILTWIINKENARAWTGFMWARVRRCGELM
jgi:hypothetical protein